MLDCETTFAILADAGVSFYAGVPDSLLKDFCAYVADHVAEERHLIAANEGAAVAVVAGHHLATGDLGLVYMQNSGLGNAVNPLLSLADPAVYAIPMLLLIGWRGEPGRHDEPQHVQQGRVTLPMLAAMGVETVVLASAPAAAEAQLRQAVDLARRRSAPCALVARAGTFARYQARGMEQNPYALSREEALKLVADALPEDAAIVSTTGMTSRELFEHRVARSEDPGRDFLTVGSMGHASQIALGIAMARPRRRIVCLDGDGALLMHMGAVAIIGSRRPRALLHVVLNNGAHDSVGGQPTAGYGVDIPALALACGYGGAARADSAAALRQALVRALSAAGPFLLEVRIHPGARADLGRPTSTPAQNKEAFVARLRE
jgi:phosphonopyruvate decarboxylase